jgi:AraC family transcriptional regulator
MDAKVVTVDSFKIIGLEYFGKNLNGEIPALWTVFNQRDVEIKNGLPGGCYGVCSEMNAEGEFSYVACLKVSQVEAIPTGMVTKEVPSGKYAMFTFKDHLSKLGEFYDNIYGVWMAELGFQHEMRPDFEHYDDRFMKNGEFDIYIPIQ